MAGEALGMKSGPAAPSAPSGGTGTAAASAP
jgi:hypothetical protein